MIKSYQNETQKGKQSPDLTSTDSSPLWKHLFFSISLNHHLRFRLQALPWCFRRSKTATTYWSGWSNDLKRRLQDWFAYEWKVVKCQLWIGHHHYKQWRFCCKIFWSLNEDIAKLNAMYRYLYM